jgi:hypothetical protein
MRACVAKVVCDGSGAAVRAAPIWLSPPVQALPESRLTSWPP